jgi:hypothetical protein
MVDKLALPFQLLSDPEGDLAKRCGVWNEDEGVAEPAIVVLDPSGKVRYAYTGGKDFSDRPAEDEVISALDEAVGATESGGNASGEPEIRFTADEAAEKTVRPERPPMSLESLRPYYLGSYFTSVALKKRLGENEASEKVDEYREQVERHSEAVRQTLKMKG